MWVFFTNVILAPMPLAAKKRRGKGKEEKIEEEWIGGSEGKMVGKL